MNEDELKVLIEAALDFEKSLNNITGQMSQLTDRLKTYQIKVTAGLDKTSSRQKINDDLKSLKTTGPKVVGQLDKKATKKQVNDAVKQLQTTQIKLKGVMDETALKQQLSKVKADADINVTGSEQVKELRENMDKAGDSANAMAAKLYLARTALQALRKAAHEAIETVAELDKAATTLAIVTGGRSGEAYDLIAQYNELAKQLGATTVQISDAATSWLRQGKTTAETAELIEQSMILSKVAMVDSATATKNLTSAMRGYGMEVKDVASIVDKLSALDSKAAVTASDLAVAMSQTASSAKIGGVSMDRLLGYLTAVQEVTQRSPETIGQAFKTIFARMGNIKLGNFLSDDGEDLSDVETILKHYGIALRDLNGDFKAVTTTLDNLFPVWEEFKTIDKRAIAQAFAGTRQQENFLVLMENYGKAIEYAGVAAESAGNSMEKFAAYEESIEAKANAFTAALEGLTLDTVDSGFVGDLIDAGTAVVEFIDKTELLKATLLGLGAGATLKAVSALSGEFHTAKQTVLSLGEAMQTLRNVDNIEALSGETISRLGVLTKGLNDEQLRLVLSSQQLSTAQMQAILTAGGMSQAEATAKLQTMGLATAEGTATTATVGFSGAMMGLGTAIKAAFATNPIGMLMLSVGVIYEVITGVTALHDALMAVNHIKSNWGSLLDELTNWNYQFGSDLTTEIESAWDKAIQAAQNYFSYVSGNDVTGKDYVKYYESTNQGGSGGSGSGGSNKNYTVADTKKTQDYSDLDMVHAIVARMKEYAAAWKPGDPTGEHSKAATEAARLPQYGVEAEFRNGSGIWEIEEDKFNPKNKGKNLYSVYHTGGIVGGGEIKANEKFALLKDKEWVLSEEMVDNLSKQMERINTLSKAFEGMTPQAISPAQVLPEIVRVDGGSSIQNITHNRPVEVNLNGDTIIQGADKTTVEKHKKITRDQVNEIAKMLRIR